MKISIYNFKSIKSIVEYEIKPLTILSGVNSSGKSSFIQLLLLLRQTIDLDSSKYQLYLSGDLYQVLEFKDILNEKKLDNKLKIVFEFDKEEFLKNDKNHRINIFNSMGNYKCKIEVIYDFSDNKIFISNFDINFIFIESEKKQYIHFKNEAGNYSIDTNTGIFANELFYNKRRIKRIIYSGIYPLYYEWFNYNEALEKEITEKGILEIDDIKKVIDSFFKNFSYIGPLREQPKDEYLIRGIKDYVGPKGENVAEVLENRSGDPIQFYKMIEDDNLIKYKKVECTLLDGVKFWICNIFKLGKDIYTRKSNESYSIVIVNESGIETTIKHVGFGISQILPIIVEGLIMPENGMLILEQPEIHLHPKLQSLLFDFLYSLTLREKSIIIETHSDHFITRMRRRVAEDLENSILNKINLTFIESDKDGIIFRSLDLDDNGTLNYFPRDFIEQSNLEAKSIIKAQLKKRNLRK